MTNSRVIQYTCLGNRVLGTALRLVQSRVMNESHTGYEMTLVHLPRDAMLARYSTSRNQYKIDAQFLRKANKK